VLPQKFRELRELLGLRGLPVQLPFELSNALARVAKRSQLLKFIDDLVHFVVNHGTASYPVYGKNLEAPAPTG